MSNYKWIATALAPLKKKRPLKKLAVVDIETNRWLDDTYGMDPQDIQAWHNKPIQTFLLTFYDGKTTQHFDGKNAIRNFLKMYLRDRYRSYVTFAHNGGKFDFIALYHTLVNDPQLGKRYWIKPLLAHGRIIAFVVHDHKKHTWHFRDSYPLLLSSLARLSESFNPEHHKITMPTGSYNRNKDQWKNYCENDCLALYEIMKMFIKIIDEDVNGCVGYTAASTAMLTFRKRFLHQSIPTYYSYNNIFRNAYYGGRVEVFNMYAMETGTPYYYYDINSQYPWVMANHQFPISMPRSVKYRDASECKGRCGIMECDVITPDDLDIPILPYKDPIRNKLIFPLGHWHGWYDFSFIQKVLDYGYIIKPYRVYEFEADYLFKEYVEQFYKLKCETSGAFRNIMKILLNSLYGKFAEHEEQEELITDPNEDITGSYPYDEEFGYSIRTIKNLRPHQLVAIAARVTSLAQLKLYSYIETIQRLGGQIYYCDTDSIVTDIRIPTSKELGDVKLEHEIIEAVFLAPKAYCLHTYDKDNEYKTIMKGFSPEFKDHITLQDFRNALPPKNNFTPFQEKIVRPASFKQIHVRHLDGFVTMVETKSIESIYNKREILPDLKTRPWMIKEF
jgi:hypothetical protein